MQTRRRAEIIIETEEVLLVRKSRFTEDWCEACGEQVALMTDEDAARLTGTSLDALRLGVASGAVHALQMPDGQFIICLKSLFNKNQN
jgi:hypothetical protein